MRPDSSEYGKLCADILNASSKVQSVAVLNKMGRPVERICKPAFPAQFPEKVSEMLYMQCVLQVSMGRDFDEQYGPINYYVSERANAVLLTFPIGDNVVFLTASKNISPIALAKKVSIIISGSEKQSPLDLEAGKILVNA